MRWKPTLPFHEGNMTPGESVDNPVARTFTLPREGEVIQHKESNYYLGKYIGEGSWGVVFHCTDDWENELVAKILKPRNRTYEAVKDEWIKELNNLVQLRHPNITFVYDAFEYRDTFYIIMERCEHTVHELIETPNIKGEEWLPVVAHSILQGIAFIHKEGYVHKDIHPWNVFSSLIRDKLVPTKDPVIVFKIGDLGITNLETEMDVFNTMVGKWMMPPEFLRPDQYGKIGKQVDMYHAGLVFLSLLLGRIPTFTESDILDGGPRNMAEQLKSIYSPAIAKALRRHVENRTQTALDFWKDISTARTN
jgi:serine/threonine-protein kinase